MSFQVQIDNLQLNILQVIEDSPLRTDAKHKHTGPSLVGQDNPHRFVLEKIRSDLLHFDPEKKDRIIFMINKHLLLEEPTKELVILLERVLEVVQSYQETGHILISPVKPESSHSKINNSEDTSSIARKLFDGL